MFEVEKRHIAVLSAPSGIIVRFLLARNAPKTQQLLHFETQSSVFLVIVMAGANRDFAWAVVVRKRRLCALRAHFLLQKITFLGGTREKTRFYPQKYRQGEKQ